MSGEKRIKVSMLGGCSLSFEDKMIDGKNVCSRRIWKLIEYLLTYRFRCVAQDELIDLLYQEEKSGKPAGALKTLLHRAREALGRLGYADGKEMIIKCAGGYRWNPEISMDLDTERFESLIRQATLHENDGARRLELQLEALSLYRGDFLPEAASDLWAMSVTAYFHYQYMSVVQEVLQALAARDRNDEVIAVAGKATAIDPYDERLYFNLILALANTNRIQAARTQYERMAKLFYGEFGISPSKELQALYKSLMKTSGGSERELGAVTAELCANETDGGALFCEYEFFRDIFRLERASAERDGRSLHLCLVAAESAGEGQLSAKSLDTAMRRLCVCIRSNLRAGDVFARCSVSQYVVLLPLADLENSERVMERVVKRFHRLNPRSPVELSFSVRTVKLEDKVQV